MKMTSVNVMYFSACLRDEQKTLVYVTAICMAVTSIKILPYESFIISNTELSRDFLLVDL